MVIALLLALESMVFKLNENSAFMGSIQGVRIKRKGKTKGKRERLNVNKATTLLLNLLGHKALCIAIDI